MEAWSCSIYPSWWYLTIPVLFGALIFWAAMGMKKKPSHYKDMTDKQRRQLPRAHIAFRLTAAIFGQLFPVAAVFFLYQPASLTVTDEGLEVRLSYNHRQVSWEDVTQASIIDATDPEYESMNLTKRVERGTLRGGLHSRTVNSWLFLAGAETGLSLQVGERMRYLIAPPPGEWEAFFEAVSPHIESRFVPES